jgi:hypothetical protein
MSEESEYILSTTLVSGDWAPPSSGAITWMGKIIELGVPKDSKFLGFGRSMQTGDLVIWWLGKISNIIDAVHSKRKFILLPQGFELEYAFYDYLGMWTGHWLRIADNQRFYENAVFLFEITRPEKRTDVLAIGKVLDEERKKRAMPIPA